MNAGAVAMEQKKHGRSRELLEESLAIMRSLGNDSGIGSALQNLGQLALETGEHDRAYELLMESLSIRLQLREMRGIIRTLISLMVLAKVQRFWRVVAVIDGVIDFVAASAAPEQPSLAERVVEERRLCQAAAQGALPAQAVAAHYEMGRAATWDRVKGYVEEAFGHLTADEKK
jgi:hypothetical protein